MSLDKSTLERVAYLARIKIEDSEIEKMITELNNIMKWIEELNEVDVNNVKPMTGVSNNSLREREDEVNDGGYSDEIVSNAPEKIDNSFTVPKVIE
ncbi:MAG: Asp-tRNA(Asn)/Glu-tRNA(Gln) amidotransferase GatCAB subunit C [Pelagibacterales bacterium]|nr:Asp-tRNA(Asn)/Glu-tRNA(Gln) amidotransferase GatCAB subunit C [Pelagibacterales bacterium]PPR15342.1 MAG: Glutamyl-tRNA(Gln) amidotransferase subunit C [Alphaproteobacteria bacterium MarineAlpha9_Bin3]|tara:strand:- start:4339 stop:4626 length:288 start_codon:yes stop_codon:yes gene_type:complete